MHTGFLQLTRENVIINSQIFPVLVKNRRCSCADRGKTRENDPNAAGRKRSAGAGVSQAV